MSIDSIEARVEKAKRIPLPEWLNPVPLPTVLNRDIPVLLKVAKAAKVVQEVDAVDNMGYALSVLYAALAELESME